MPLFTNEDRCRHSHLETFRESPRGFWNRYVGIPMDPKYSDQDVADIIAALRKVYPAVLGS